MQPKDKVRIRAGMGDYSHCVGEVSHVKSDAMIVLFLTSDANFRKENFFTTDAEKVPQDTRFTVIPALSCGTKVRVKLTGRVGEIVGFAGESYRVKFQFPEGERWYTKADLVTVPVYTPLSP